MQEWLPALDGVVDKLNAGATVADVGCGHGVSTILMAQAFPKSTFMGYDFHPGSIAAATAHAHRAWVCERPLRGRTGAGFPGSGYDFVTCFDCLHDMGDPAAAAAHVRKALKPGGTWMVVEPNAGDRLEDNLNPVGRLYYSASTMICVPTSLAQETGTALGAQAGEARIAEVIRSGGFTKVRRAAETPLNMVLEATSRRLCSRARTRRGCSTVRGVLPTSGVPSQRFHRCNDTIARRHRSSAARRHLPLARR